MRNEEGHGSRGWQVVPLSVLVSSTEALAKAARPDLACLIREQAAELRQLQRGDESAAPDRWNSNGAGENGAP